MRSEVDQLWDRMSRLDPDTPRIEHMPIESLRAWVVETQIGDTHEKMLTRLAAYDEQDAKECRHYEPWRLRLRLALMAKAHDGMKLR